MDHSVLTILDLGIIAAYLVIMVLVGVYSVRRIQNTKDYYVAGRSFGPMVLMATVCATIIGGSGLMGRAGVAYTDGFKAVLTAIPYLLGMFIFSGIAGKISDIGMQYGITSIPELFERRFGRAAKITLSVLIAFAMMGTVASQVTATATIIRMLGGEFGLSYEMGALIATVVFMVYTATSGLFGVVYTDVLQFYMLIVFVYILIPVAALFNVGGFANFAANLDPALVEPHIDGSILGDIITYLVFTMAGAEMWQRAFAAKSRRAAKRGMFLGTAVYGVTIVLVYFMGVVGRQILGGDILAQYGSTDAVVPALAIRILPAGLTGLALAGMLSVIMSTADSYLLVSVQTCVHDIGKTIRPQMPERTEISLFLHCPAPGRAGDRVVHPQCIQHPHVRLELLCRIGWDSRICSAVLEEGNQDRRHGRVAGRVCCLRWLEAGRPALRPWGGGAGHGCLRYRTGRCEPCDL